DSPMYPIPSLLFLLVMLKAAIATQTIKRPDYARDTGLPDVVLTKYEKSNWLYRKLMKPDPYHVVDPKHLSEAKKLDAEFGKKGGFLVKPSLKKEQIDRRALPHQTRIRLSQPQQAQWAYYRNPAIETNKGLLDKKAQSQEVVKRVFAANPYVQYVSGGNPMDPYGAARSAEGGARIGPNLEELRARLPETETRVVKPIGRRLHQPPPWETYDSFGRRSLIPKRLAPIPFLDKANARREAINKYYGQKNPPGFVHWPQAAPAYLQNAEEYALANHKHLKILENGGVRAAINSDNPALVDATFKHYGELEMTAPRRTEWEKAEMMKDSQRIAEAFKWERIKDKLKDTNNHMVAQLKAAGKHLPVELERQRKFGMKNLKRMSSTHSRYGQNEMHAEKNKLFRREKVATHPLDALWLSSMLLEKGMEGHWPHIDDKDNRHYGVPSPWAGGHYNPIQSTFNKKGPFRNWHPDRLSGKCIGTSYGHIDSEDCFTNGQWGAAWGTRPRQHSLSHPAEYQVAGGMQFSQEKRDNLRRKWIKAGTSQHEIEQLAQRNWKDEEEFQYPQRWSAYRRDDTNKFVITEAQDNERGKVHPSGSEEDRKDNPWAYAPLSSTFAHLQQATAPRSRNWNLQFVQDYNFDAPKTLGVYIQNKKNVSRVLRPFSAPPPNLQISPDMPKLDGDLRHPDPSGSGALDNPMAGLVYEVEYDLRDHQSTYQKTFGSNPQGLHPTDPGIPDIIMEGRLICFGDVGAEDGQISLFSDTAHISSAFTDKDGRFKLATTMDYAPHKLKVTFFHQCKESTEEKLAGKGEQGEMPLPLKYGDRRVYDLGEIDSSDPEYNWERTERQIEGVEYQGDEFIPAMAKLRPCDPNTMGAIACNAILSATETKDKDKPAEPDLDKEKNAVPGKTQFGLDRDAPQFVPHLVRN
ncbi:hypothetical protein PENTCL1PPCAC_11877, partial [Pristionchus entomophagus]